MSNPLHSIHDAGRVERDLIARFGLPGVILSTTNSRGRGPSTARALLAAPVDRPVATKRQPAVIDAETLAPVVCLGPDALAELDDLQRSSSYLVGAGEPFCACGRRWSDCDSSRAKCRRRPVLDVDAVEVR